MVEFLLWLGAIGWLQSNVRAVIWLSSVVVKGYRAPTLLQLGLLVGLQVTQPRSQHP